MSQREDLTIFAYGTNSTFGRGTSFDDYDAISNLPALDAIADAVDGETAQKLIAKVKAGGIFASVLGAPGNDKDYPNVKVVRVYVKPDVKTMSQMVQAVTTGKLMISITRKFPLKDAAQAHAAVAQGVAGKGLLVAHIM